MSKQSKENPYVPKYIRDVPWFQEQDGEKGDYLSHHRKEDGVLNSEPKMGTGIKDEFIPISEVKEIKQNKFKRIKKKGRCLNCGGDHDRKDCLEKPGKKHGGDVDEKIVNKRNEDVDYDGKRDRWYGYDVKDYNKYLQNWDEKEKEKQKKKEEQSGGDVDREYDTDEEIELRELGLDKEEGFKDGIKQEGEKTIRLIEDKAVYLRDVKNENITYDPKSRMIRDQSTGYFNEQNLFVKHMTGEALNYEKSKKFAWDEDKRGIEANNYASNPTLADMKIQKQKNENSEKSDKLKQSIMNKYGGTMSISNKEDEEQEDEDEPIDEYRNRDPTKSKYLEDHYINNHTSVWGSYYVDGRWGYACCQGMYKNSYCNN